MAVRTRPAPLLLQAQASSSVNVICHQITDVLSPGQTLAYLQAAERQVSASVPPGRLFAILIASDHGVVCTPDLRFWFVA